MEKKLPVLATLIAVLDLCREHSSYALKIMTIWFVLILFLPNLLFSVGNSNPATEPIDGFFAWDFLDFVLYVVGWGSIAILWHRRILLADHDFQAAATFDRRVWSYLLRGFLIGILVLVAGVIVGVPSMLAATSLMGNVDQMIMYFGTTFPLAIVVGTITGRLCIALPAIALDRGDFGLRDAWRATKGNSFRLLLITATSIVLIYVTAWLLGSPSIEEASYYSFSPLPFLLKFVQQLIDFFFGLIGLTILSITYACFAEDRKLAVVQPPS